MHFKKIYIDMDGVIANWDSAARQILDEGDNFYEYEARVGSVRAWEDIYANPSFFEDLVPFPWKDDLLMLTVKHSDSQMILSAPSRVNRSLCMMQKRHWLDQHVGPNYPAIFEKDKHKYAGPNRLLIDDNERKIEKWVQAGGIGHLFTTYTKLATFLLSEDE